LAQQAQSLAVAATDEGEVYHSGYANLLSMPEFYDIDVTKAILSLLDESKSLTDLFAKALGEDPIHFLFGEELGYELLEPCGMVFTHFQAGPKKSGSLGVIGPSRLDYARVIPIVRYYGNLVEELARGI
jgi:heat-inducible transcriptional repressor